MTGMVIEGLQSWQLDTIAEIKRRDELAEEAQWANAEDMHRLHESGMTQRDIGAAIERSHVHVGYIIKVWVAFGNLGYQERPTFNEAYHSPEVRGGASSTAHVSYNGGQNEWYTPLGYISAACDVMGGIDLDPASSTTANELIEAKHIFTAEDDGLVHDWWGRIWMNPPYAQPLIAQFCQKLVDEYEGGNVTQACVLVNNATETAWWQLLHDSSSAVAFPKGRVKFWHPERQSAPLQGQTVLYFGVEHLAFRSAFAQFGGVR